MGWEGGMTTALGQAFQLPIPSSERAGGRWSFMEFEVVERAALASKQSSSRLPPDESWAVGGNFDAMQCVQTTMADATLPYYVAIHYYIVRMVGDSILPE